MPDSNNTPATADQLPSFAKEWMAQWRYAAEELPKIQAEELRKLDDEKTSGLMHQLNSAEDPYQNHLVIQQAWFTRFRILQLQKELDEKSL